MGDDPSRRRTLYGQAVSFGSLVEEFRANGDTEASRADFGSIAQIGLGILRELNQSESEVLEQAGINLGIPASIISRWISSPQRVHREFLVGVLEAIHGFIRDAARETDSVVVKIQETLGKKGTKSDIVLFRTLVEQGCDKLLRYGTEGEASFATELQSRLKNTDPQLVDRAFQKKTLKRLAEVLTEMLGTAPPEKEAVTLQQAGDTLLN